MKTGLALIMTTLLAGCATRQTTFTTPILLFGEVVQPRWTGWATDICGHGQPVLLDDRLYGDGCVPFGGELFKARLLSPKRIDGTVVARSITIAYPGHALSKQYRNREHVLLQRTTDDFAAATGIEYLAAVRNNYQSQQQCFEENGFGHADFRFCPDHAFHERHRDQCVPQAEYLSHYSTEAR